MAAAPRIKLKLQLYCGDEIAIGPGKADLLEAIAAEGSISAAGRTLGMSYRRCWMLVDAMNRCWQQPVVATTPGRTHGAARVTDFGQTLLADYRSLQQRLSADSAGSELEALGAAIRERPLPKRTD
jgi:molybdate transport system regulatory protein